MKLKTLAVLLLACLLSAGVVFLSYGFEKSGKISKIKSQFETYGLTVTEVKTANNQVCFFFKSLNIALTEEDMLLFRYILETAEKLHFDPNWEIVLENEDRLNLCGTVFAEFNGTASALEYKSTPSERDPSLLEFELRSDLAQADYSCTGIKIAAYPQIYIKNNLPQRKEVSVNIRISTSLSGEEALTKIHSDVQEAVKTQNRNGGGIAQCNVSITDPEGKILYLCSTDFLRNNVLRLI